MYKSDSAKCIYHNKDPLGEEKLKDIKAVRHQSCKTSKL